MNDQHCMMNDGERVPRVPSKGSEAMSQRVNKLYKPAELVAAIEALTTVIEDHNEARRIVKELHTLGYRVVYVGKVNE